MNLLDELKASALKVRKCHEELERANEALTKAENNARTAESLARDTRQEYNQIHDKWRESL